MDKNKRLRAAVHRAVKSSLPQFAKVGRNDLCICGSGIKFKRCHLGKLASTVPQDGLDKFVREIKTAVKDARQNI